MKTKSFVKPCLWAITWQALIVIWYQLIPAVLVWLLDPKSYFPVIWLFLGFGLPLVFYRIRRHLLCSGNWHWLGTAVFHTIGLGCTFYVFLWWCMENPLPYPWQNTNMGIAGAVILLMMGQAFAILAIADLLVFSISYISRKVKAKKNK